MPWYPYPPLAFRGTVDLRGRRGPFDVILVSGDAYVDHPSFPTAAVTRILEGLGLSVAVIAQPDWRSREDFTVFGAPNLFFGVTAGAMDSMVANFTAARLPRHDDRLSPGGRAGLRPKRAASVYSQRLREAFPDHPIVLGGIEASLRRFSHFDYWADRVQDSLLLGSGADLIFHGMAESSLKRLVMHFQEAGPTRRNLPHLPQICLKVPPGQGPSLAGPRARSLPSGEDCRAHPAALLELSRILDVSNRPGGPVLVQHYQKGDILCFPPALEEWRDEGCFVANQGFNRRQHPLYTEEIPGLRPVQFSIISHRGCVGACTFCSLALHQGRWIRSRSISDLVAEAARLASHPDFRGTIPDVGGPSVNMYGWDCELQGCATGICTSPALCPNLNAGLAPLGELMRQLRDVPGLRHIFLGSGLRFDLLREADWPWFRQILEHHVSGQLKVAPEHVDRQVLSLMRKSPDASFPDFARRFQQTCRELGKELYLVPYFLLAFPGSIGKDAAVADLVQKMHLAHEQVQEFTPTPGTLATAMFAAGTDLGGNPIAVPRTRSEREKGRKELACDRGPRPAGMLRLKDSQTGAKARPRHPRPEKKTRPPR